MKLINVYNGDFLNSSQGGGMRYLRDLMCAQSRRGFDIELLAVGDGVPRSVNIEGVLVRYVPISKTLNWPRFLFRLVVFLIKNRRLYQGSVIHLHRVYFAPPFRMLIRKAQIVCTIHTKTFSVISDRSRLGSHLLPVFIVLERLILKSCINKISVAGEYARELYAQRHQIPPTDMVTLCGPSLMQPSSPDPRLKDTKKNILCVGRLAAVKRPQKVLELFRRAMMNAPNIVSEYRLVFIGDGEERAALVKAIEGSDIGGEILAIGSVEADEMPGLYSAGCCLVLLSSSETGPFVVKEALACGLPVFATDVGNVNSYLTGECGVIVDVESPEDRVEQFISFLQTEYSHEVCRARAEEIYQKELDEFESGIDRLYMTTEGQ